MVENNSKSIDYFPPPKKNGGWRKNVDPDFVRSLGMDKERLEEFGAYNLSVPNKTNWKPYSEHKGVMVIKNGWIVGEWYEGDKSDTFLQYLASNGKSFAMVCLGIIFEECKKGRLPFKIDLESKVYDPSWLPEGLPLSDPRKSEITFSHIFKHCSGLCPESEEAGRYQQDKNFSLWVLGKEPKYNETRSLYYEPGRPEQFAGNTYTSIGFQHLGLVIPHLIGKPAHEFLWERFLEPIGFSGIDYFQPAHEWSVGKENAKMKWHAAGGLRMTPRDYGRFAYLLLRNGRWEDQQVVPAQWMSRLSTASEYPNFQSNEDGRFGVRYPKDMFRIYGSGLSWAFMVPSLDLIALRTSRADNAHLDEVQKKFLQTLFDAVG